MAFADLRGKDGTVVARKSRSGLVLSPRTTPKNPRSVAQVGARNNLTKGSRNFANLTSAQAAAWNAYGSTITKHNRVNGTAYSSAGIDIYNGLTTKFLQVTPGGTPPVTPPTSAYAGDSITMSAAGGVGTVTFTATGASAAGTKVELLLQPLKGKNRAPGTRGYRTRGFSAYGTSPYTTTLTVAAGSYAAAYRFVNTATGQMTALTPIGIVTVS